VKVMRMSGRPVLLDKLAAYDAEFKAEFDVIEAECKQDMLEFHRRLLELDKKLEPKYTVVEEWPLPRSMSQMKKIIDQYQCPIMFAQSKDNPEELMLVLMDERIV